MIVAEGLYGSSKSSYLKLENARLIVRHNAKIDETKLGARTRCIESIFVENAAGERFLFPTTSLPPARAMAEHVNQLGGFADLVGQQIQRMATDYGNLAQCSSHVFSHAATLAESASVIRETVRTKMQEMRKVFERLARPGAYVAEAARLTERATTLNETEHQEAIAIETIEEMRDLLAVEGVELSQAMLESVCQCVAGDTLEEKTTDDSARQIKVIGQTVDLSAWNDLKQKPRVLTLNPVKRAPLPAFKDKTAEMLFRLGAIVPFVQNNSMMNLLSFIVENYHDTDDRTRQMHMRAIAMAALEAARQDMNEGIPFKTRAVREFIEWMQGFDVGKILVEDVESDREYADEQAIQNFVPREFLNSSHGVDLLNDHDGKPPKKAILHALELFLTDWMETHEGIYNDDTKMLAVALYPRVSEALIGSHQHHVPSFDDDEPGVDAPFHPVSAPRFGDDFAMMDEDLQREDILLPPKNQGDDLASEVLKPTIDDGSGEETADARHISRLRTLSGMRGPA